MTDEYRAYLESRESDHQEIPKWKPSERKEEKPRESDFLEHHGINGMRWGHRRFQYKNGRLTPEGKIRYGKGSNDGQADADDEEKKRESSDSPKKSYNSKTLSYKESPQTLTDEELNRRNKRMQMEAQYNQLRSQLQPKTRAERRKELVRKVLIDSATQALSKTMSAVYTKAFYKIFDELTKHKFDLTGEKAKADKERKEQEKKEKKEQQEQQKQQKQKQPK